MKIKIGIVMMMILFWGTSCTPSGSSSQSSKSDLADYELIGNVKSVREKYYETENIDGDSINTFCIETYREFDEAGRLTYEETNTENEKYNESYEYDTSGNMVRYVRSSKDDGEWSSLNTYDTGGKLIRSVTTLNDSLQTTVTDEYTYDKNNNLIETKTSSSDGSEYSTINIYDDKSRLIERRYGSDGQFSNKTFYYYNDMDSLAYSKEYSSGFLCEEVVYSYDDKGIPDKIEYKGYDEEGKYSYLHLVYLDENGNVTLQEDYDPDRILTYKVENTYDTKGFLLTSSIYSSSDKDILRVYSHSKYKYNEKGDLVETVTHFPEDGDTQTSKKMYEYDRKGNRTRIEFVQFYDATKQPIRSITVREITYYD